MTVAHVNDVNEVIVKINNILENIFANQLPVNCQSTANQPPIPQISLQPPTKENENELKRKQAQKSIIDLMKELQKTYQETDMVAIANDSSSSVSKPDLNFFSSTSNRTE